MYNKLHLKDVFIMVIFDEDKLYFSICFEKFVSNKLNFPVFLPKRAMIGSVDDERNVFTELSSGKKYLNFYDIWKTNIPLGFELCISVKEIMDELDEKDLGVVFSNLWEYYETQVFFYCLIEGSHERTFAFKEKQEFYEEFGVDFRSVSTIDSNSLLDDYVEGKLTSDEYYSKVYKKTNDNIIHLFPKK